MAIVTDEHEPDWHEPGPDDAYNWEDINEPEAPTPVIVDYPASIPPRDIPDALTCAHSQGLEPWMGSSGDWISFQCPACKTLGVTSTATVEKIKIAGVLRATCETCHDDIAPGILAILGQTVRKNNSTSAESNGTPTLIEREPTVVNWAEYRSKTQPETKWLVKGFLPASGFSVIGSTPKAGKTWFLGLLAISCATGRPFLGRFIVVEPIRVHFLALEGSAPALRNRIGCLARGMGIDPDDDLLGNNLYIDYKPPGVNLSEAPYAAWYCSEVERIDAQLCLVDTVRRAARIRESGEGVGDLQRLSENLEPIKNTRSILFAHHARKMAPANQGGTWTPPLERLSGSGDWGGLVEMGVVLDRRKGTEWRDTRVEVDGRDIPGFPPMRVIYEGDGTGPEGLLTYQDTLEARIEETPETQEEGTTLSAEKISAWLATQPRVEATTAQISEAFGVHKKTVLRARGAFKQWGIAATEVRHGVSQSFYLESPSYSHLRKGET